MKTIPVPFERQVPVYIQQPQHVHYAARQIAIPHQEWALPQQQVALAPQQHFVEAAPLAHSYEPSHAPLALESYHHEPAGHFQQAIAPQPWQ